MVGKTFNAMFVAGVVALNAISWRPAAGQFSGPRFPGREEMALEGFFGGSLFEYDAFNVYDPEKSASRLDVHCSFVYDVLQFVRAEGDTYTARYEFSAILRRGKEPVDFKSALGSVTVDNYPETNSRTRRVAEQVAFYPPAGEYELEFRLTDLESNKTLVRKKKVLVRDFGKPGVHLSDVVFADSFACSLGDTAELVPFLTARYAKPESGFVAIVQAVPVPDTERVSLRWEVRTQAGASVCERAESLRGYRRLCLHLDKCVSRPGRYELRIEARTRSYRAEAKREFSVVWGEAFIDTTDLDMIIEAMRYIAKEEDLDRMRQASPSMKRRLFEDFWAERDPTPDTPENELKEEFFRRLDFANRFFSVPDLGIEGWETDRGRIFIIYGQPTHVEREPAQMDRASYEIWYYSHLRRRFVFVDEDGNGLYKLRSAD